MNKYISVNKEGIKQLQRTFKINGKEICERCVKNALAYRTNNDLAKKIRFTAVKYHGGCTYYVFAEPECFFDSDGSMRYVCPNKAEIYLDKQTGEGVIYDPKGKVVARYDSVRVSQIGEMQRYAAQLG